MKKEVEVKFFVDDLGKVRKKLQKLGAKFEWAGSEHDTFLDTAGLALKKRGDILRIRRDKESRVTFKRNVRAREKFKIADEHQLDISDAKELQGIFEHLGFRVHLEYKKRREYWEYDGAGVTLDKLPFGTFVEIEASQKKIKTIASKLGLDFDKSTTKGYRRLVEEHRKNGKIEL